MKNQIFVLLTAFCAVLVFTSFIPKENNRRSFLQKDTTITVNPLIEKVLTKEQQQSYTPDMVIQSLKEGSKRFMSNSLTARDHSMMVRDASMGQYP